MQLIKEKFLVGLVGPEVLESAENDPFHPVRLDLDSCGALEIRYDFFDPVLWPELSERVRKIVPGKLQIGTIRLKRDGGTFADAKLVERLELWQKILSAREVPEWLDLERDCLHDFKALSELAQPRSVQILVSEHNFVRVPSEYELEMLARDLRRMGAPGLKIASISNSSDDSVRLYKFIKKQSKYFKLFAAFGMGETGVCSRIMSLKEGANLTYGAIGRIAAPGQIDVATMKKAIDQLDSFTSDFELKLFLDKNA